MFTTQVFSQLSILKYGVYSNYPVLILIEKVEDRLIKMANAARTLADICTNIGANFTGEGDDVEAFLRKVETCCEIFPNGAGLKLSVTKLKLDKTALAHVELQPAAVRNDFEALSTELKTRFGDRRRVDDYVRDLAQVKQGPSETVRDFVARVEELAHRATPATLTDEQRATSKREYSLLGLKTGLRPELYERMLFSDWTVWNIVKSNALKLDGSIAAQAPVTHGLGRSYGPPQTEVSRGYQPPFLRTRSQGPRRGALTCFRCGGLGHRAVECPTEAPFQPQSYGAYGPQGTINDQGHAGRFPSRPQGGFQQNTDWPGSYTGHGAVPMTAPFSQAGYPNVSMPPPAIRPPYRGRGMSRRLN